MKVAMENMFDNGWANAYGRITYCVIQQILGKLCVASSFNIMQKMLTIKPNKHIVSKH
jgi:hypothetical protein